MGHMANEEYLHKENIDEYLEALARKINMSGVGRHRILVVGGAAMAIKYSDARSTVDIDICFREQNQLYSCCQSVAKDYDLPDDWINADVMHSDSFSYLLFDNAEYYKVYGNILEVYVAADIDLYCMKVISFRPKDIQDMEVLAEGLKEKGISIVDIINNFIRLYGNEYYLRSDPRKLRFVEMQFGEKGED
ncbi:MAG: hypothetical protein J5712_05765 [Lachnospiraceae bacterium]|nr:hypothetical protein [Lachnospiraceae bacterium]